MCNVMQGTFKARAAAHPHGSQGDLMDSQVVDFQASLKVRLPDGEALCLRVKPIVPKHVQEELGERCAAEQFSVSRWGILRASIILVHPGVEVILCNEASVSALLHPLTLH